jgi:hypothetical protein
VSAAKGKRVRFLPAMVINRRHDDERQHRPCSGPMGKTVREDT